MQSELDFTKYLASRSTRTTIEKVQTGTIFTGLYDRDFTFIQNPEYCVGPKYDHGSPSYGFEINDYIS